MNLLLGPVVEDKDKVKVLEAELDALKVGNLHVLEAHDEERELNHVEQAVDRRLDKDIVAEGDAVEPKVLVGDVELDAVVLLHALHKGLEVGVDLVDALPLPLLVLDLLRVSPPAALGLTQRQGGLHDLLVELDVHGLLLSHHDLVPQVEVQHHNEGVVSGLENGVFYVVKGNVYRGQGEVMGRDGGVPMFPALRVENRKPLV